MSENCAAESCAGLQTDEIIFGLIFIAVIVVLWLVSSWIEKRRKEREDWWGKDPW